MLLDTTGHFVVNIISISPLSYYGLGVPLSSARLLHSMVLSKWPRKLAVVITWSSGARHRKGFQAFRGLNITPLGVPLRISVPAGISLRVTGAPTRHCGHKLELPR